MTTEQPIEAANPVPLIVIKDEGFGHEYPFTQHEADLMRLAITDTLAWWWDDVKKASRFKELHQRIGHMQSARTDEWVCPMPLTNGDIRDIQWALRRAATRFLKANPAGSGLASKFLDLDDRINGLFEQREGEGE